MYPGGQHIHPLDVGSWYRIPLHFFLPGAQTLLPLLFSLVNVGYIDFISLNRAPVGRALCRPQPKRPCTERTGKAAVVCRQIFLPGDRGNSTDGYQIKDHTKFESKMTVHRLVKNRLQQVPRELKFTSKPTYTADLALWLFTRGVGKDKESIPGTRHRRNAHKNLIGT